MPLYTCVRTGLLTKCLSRFVIQASRYIKNRGLLPGTLNITLHFQYRSSSRLHRYHLLVPVRSPGLLHVPLLDTPSLQHSRPIRRRPPTKHFRRVDSSYASLPSHSTNITAFLSKILNTRSQPSVCVELTRGSTSDQTVTVPSSKIPHSAKKRENEARCAPKWTFAGQNILTRHHHPSQAAQSPRTITHKLVDLQYQADLRQETAQSRV